MSSPFIGLGALQYFLRILWNAIADWLMRTFLFTNGIPEEEQLPFHFVAWTLWP